MSRRLRVLFVAVIIMLAVIVARAQHLPLPLAISVVLASAVLFELMARTEPRR